MTVKRVLYSKCMKDNGFSYRVPIWHHISRNFTRVLHEVHLLETSNLIVSFR
jgi:hypothetical protein